MGRAPRPMASDVIYHVINRANGRMTLFRKDADYQAFEQILEEAVERYSMRLLAYCIMPNHWHLILYPYDGKDLSNFMQWLTLTHTRRWHAHYHTNGYGHAYQGRFKSFPVEMDNYFMQLCRYVERNPLRAKLVSKAEDWQWSSLWRRVHGTADQQTLLSPWPIPSDKNYLLLVNTEELEDELKTIRNSVNRGAPYGSSTWLADVVSRFGLGSTLKPRGRPKKGT